MPLINTSVPNLIQGVSQQPDASRFAGQCEEQENALSSVAEGLKKRPNTRHVARLLGQAISSNSFVHFINRDGNEKYVLIHDGTNLRAFNLETGALAQINGANAYPVSGTYLETTTARETLKALTIADSTFLLNKQVGIGLGADKSPLIAKEALVFIKQGDYGKKYGFEVEVTSTAGTNAVVTVNSNYYSGQGVSTLRYYISSLSIPSGGTGTGFAANDIVDIPLFSSRSITVINTHYGFTYGPFNFGLTVYTQPTMKVLSVDSNGKILTAQIQNQGSFVYAGQGHRFGTGPVSGDTHSDMASGDWSDLSSPASINVPSTNNTSAALTTTTLTKTYTSGASSSASNADTTTILTNVANLTTGNTGTWSTYFTTESKIESNVLVLKGNSSVVDFSIVPKDGLGGEGIGVIYKETSSINNLPLVAKNGFEVKIVGDAELNQDDYYVKFETTDGEDIGRGSWIECAAPDIILNYNTDTLPIEIVSNGTDFTLRTMKMADRKAGDDNSNPLSSFVGQFISNVFFFKNRLGFLSGDNVIMSESGLGGLDDTGQLEFNFARTTVTSLLDSDPIDVSVASSLVTNLKSAQGFQENLMLFSNNGQFVLKGGDVLTPKTVSITPVTNFNFEEQVDPLPIGSYIYFPFTRGAYTGLREFTLNATTDTYDSVEVTEHIPAYIPKNIVDIAGTTTEETIALLSEDEPTALYLYNYFWNNNQKVLSAWSKFTFDENIRGIEFVESTLYMVVTDDEENTHLVSLPFESGLKDVDYDGSPSDFLTLLDKRVRAKITSGSSVVEFEQSDSSYSGANADHPYTFFNGTIPSGGQALSEVFVDSNGVTHSLKYQNVGSGGQVLLTEGNASATLYGYVGVPYTMKYKFSTQVFKAQTQKGASPTASSSMQVRNGSLFFDDTHTFDVKVTPEKRPTATTTFSADDVPEAEQLGAIKFAEGNFRFPVYSKAKHADIVIENDSPFDSKFSSAEFESFVHPRSSRYG